MLLSLQSKGETRVTDVTAGAADAKFNFGGVIGQTFGLIGRNFVAFAFLALIFVGVPQFGISYAQSAVRTDPELVMWVSLLGVLVSLVTTYILQGALTRAAVDDLSGAGVKFGAAIADGLRYFFPLFIVALIVTIGMTVGFLLLIIPGIILAVRWCITAPIVVVERIGPTSSMGRSADLTEGNRWAVFGLLVLYLVFAYAVQIVFGLAMAAAYGSDPTTELMSLDAIGVAILVASALVTALITLVSTVGTAALYFELRRVKEGVGVSELAAVFD
jgi:hypothetical protein